jgi:hypothetical protein
MRQPVHAAFSVAQFLTSKGIMVMPQPSYSPDLAPCDFFLFQKTKLVVKGHHFETTEDIQRSVTAFLKLRSRNATNNGSTSGKRVCRH